MCCPNSRDGEDVSVVQELDAEDPTTIPMDATSTIQAPHISTPCIRTFPWQSLYSIFGVIPMVACQHLIFGKNLYDIDIFFTVSALPPHPSSS